MNPTPSIMDQLRADNLLAGTFILKRIEELKQSLQYQTDSTFVSFEDHFETLVKGVNGLSDIQLKSTIPTMQMASAYEQELLQSLSTVQDECERMSTKIVYFMGKIASAKAEVDDEKAAFGAWYSLAAQDLIARLGIKLSATNISNLAASEFNRLMVRSSMTLDGMLESLKIERTRVDNRRKLVRTKVEMGRAQANAAWSNLLPPDRGHSSQDPSMGTLVENDYDDEPVEKGPSFVREEPAITAGPTQDEVPVANDRPQMLGLYCSFCQAPQIQTPSGPSCSNGHGGADGLTAKEVLERLARAESTTVVMEPIDDSVAESVDAVEETAISILKTSVSIGEARPVEEVETSTKHSPWITQAQEESHAAEEIPGDYNWEGLTDSHPVSMDLRLEDINAFHATHPASDPEDVHTTLRQLGKPVGIVAFDDDDGFVVPARKAEPDVPAASQPVYDDDEPAVAASYVGKNDPVIAEPEPEVLIIKDIKITEVSHVDTEVPGTGFVAAGGTTTQRPEAAVTNAESELPVRRKMALIGLDDDDIPEPISKPVVAPPEPPVPVVIEDEGNDSTIMTGEVAAEVTRVRRELAARRDDGVPPVEPTIRGMEQAVQFDPTEVASKPSPSPRRAPMNFEFDDF